MAEILISELFTPGHDSLAIANALSDSFDVDIFNTGVHWQQSFRRGRPHTDFTRVGDTERTGTSFRLMPDPTILNDGDLRAGLSAGRLVDLMPLSPRDLFEYPRRPDAMIRFRDDRDGSSTTWVPHALPAPDEVLEFVWWPDSFTRFVVVLADDFDRHGADWENRHPPDLLESSAAWVADSVTWEDDLVGVRGGGPDDAVRVAEVLHRVHTAGMLDDEDPRTFWELVDRIAREDATFRSWRLLAAAVLAAKYYE